MSQLQSHEMHPQRWGDPAHAAALPESTRGLVDLFIGVVDSPASQDAPVPPSRLDSVAVAALTEVVGSAQVLMGEDIRRLRTRGKSTPDLLLARNGDLGDAPDAVVRPRTHEEVAAVLAWAMAHRVAIVAFGGGTSVVGGLVADQEGFAGVVCLDLHDLDQLIAVDQVSMTARLGAGMRAPEAEAALSQHGLTLGHFPQSFEYATIGGFAATRSSGQASAGFGRFDDMVVGLKVATPIGDLDLGAAPASAAGPDLREVLLGSEGTLGVITEVVLRVRRIATESHYEAWSFDSFEAGAEAMRLLAQGRTLPTVVRLSDETESMVNLASQTDVGGEGASGCLMIVGHEGDSIAIARATTAQVLAAAGGTSLGAERGESWKHGRFQAPYLRDSLLDVGVLVETLETATFWSNRDRVYQAVKQALQDSLGEGTLVMCHISHVYETGCALYFTVAARQGADPLGRWRAAKSAASEALLAAGATITHHHAVGRDHLPWLAREIGPVGVAMLRGLKKAVDPAGILNPGVLIP